MANKRIISYRIGRLVYKSSPKLSLRSCLAFLDYADSQGVWLIPLRIFQQAFKENKETLNLKLAYFVRAGLLVKVINGLYANPRADSKPEPLYILYDIAKHLRSKELFYESLESRASELSLILQCPNRLTFVTSGKSKTYFTPYGTLEFVHKDIDKEIFNRMVNKKLIFFDKFKKVFCACKEQVKEDMRSLNRSVDLLAEGEFYEET